jgi:ankyrin repeat protein
MNKMTLYNLLKTVMTINNIKFKEYNNNIIDSEILLLDLVKKLAKNKQLWMNPQVLNSKTIHVNKQLEIVLHYASEHGYFDIVKLSIEYDTDIHSNSDYALRFAAGNNHLEIVKILIKNGAYINTISNYALRVASEKGHLEIVKILIENDADIHAISDYALRYASGNGHLEIVKYLIEKGADIHAELDYALRFASGHNHLLVVQFLIENGADIHAIIDYPLRFAAEKGHLEIVKYLCEKGADINAISNDALKLALRNNHLLVVKYLIDNGADINVVFHYISLNENSDISIYLYSMNIFNFQNKPDNIIFRECMICPISIEDFTSETEKIGCATCLNIFEKNSLQKWFIVKGIECPLKCRGNTFYIVK